MIIFDLKCARDGRVTSSRPGSARARDYRSAGRGSGRLSALRLGRDRQGADGTGGRARAARAPLAAPARASGGDAPGLGGSATTSRTRRAPSISAKSRPHRSMARPPARRRSRWSRTALRSRHCPCRWCPRHRSIDCRIDCRHRSALIRHGGLDPVAQQDRASDSAILGPLVRTPVGVHQIAKARESVFERPLFVDHPRSLGMSWAKHGAGAVRISARTRSVLELPASSMLHVPGWFTQTAGRTVEAAARSHAPGAVPVQPIRSSGPRSDP